MEDMRTAIFRLMMGPLEDDVQTPDHVGELEQLEDWADKLTMKEYAAEIEAAEGVRNSSGGWFDMLDERPPDNTLVLIGKWPLISYAQYVAPVKRWYSQGGRCLTWTPTHWQHVAPPPEGA